MRVSLFFAVLCAELSLAWGRQVKNASVVASGKNATSSKAQTPDLLPPQRVIDNTNRTQTTLLTKSPQSTTTTTNPPSDGNVELPKPGRRRIPDSDEQGSDEFTSPNTNQLPQLRTGDNTAAGVPGSYDRKAAPNPMVGPGAVSPNGQIADNDQPATEQEGKLTEKRLKARPAVRPTKKRLREMQRRVRLICRHKFRDYRRLQRGKLRLSRSRAKYQTAVRKCIRQQLAKELSKTSTDAEDPPTQTTEQAVEPEPEPEPESVPNRMDEFLSPSKAAGEQLPDTTGQEQAGNKPVEEQTDALDKLASEFSDLMQQESKLNEAQRKELQTINEQLVNIQEKLKELNI